jgi:selenocysteine lyase/cysteine desulfurase
MELACAAEGFAIAMSFDSIDVPPQSLQAVANAASSFHVPGPGPYALTHSVGCLPRASAIALETALLRPWIERGGEAWEDWLQEVETFRTELALLLGGAPAEYCPQANLSTALAKVLLALPPPVPGKRVVIAAEDSFPSLGFVLRQAQRHGYELQLIPRSADPAQIDTWAAALKSTTCAVLVTHVHSNTGVVAPVADIARLCRERNILCIVDIAQSAGILPLSLPASGADIVLGSCVKWLCGGPGAGFMWVRSELIASLEPVDVGWFSHARPFEFDIHRFEYAADARRFWGGTPSIAPFVLAAASVRCIRELGVPAIHAYNRQLIRAFLDELSAAWRSRVPSDLIGGTLCIPTGAALPAIQNALRAADVRFDTRDDTVRLSFHVCNRMEDAQRIAHAWGRATI